MSVFPYTPTTHTHSFHPVFLWVLIMRPPYCMPVHSNRIRRMNLLLESNAYNACITKKWKFQVFRETCTPQPNSMNCKFIGFRFPQYNLQPVWSIPKSQTSIRTLMSLIFCVFRSIYLQIGRVVYRSTNYEIQHVVSVFAFQPRSRSLCEQLLL